ncbi:Tn7-like element transposition protein TnsE [Priestia flexa]|uniref:Tn7-like element transposition protein TnsE n=1 Tax=Priestia flexa TaxID=86664 RepID=UPI00240E222F|nr:Tn7-like element transposition protein TnsE [Priestia flexa]WEZ08678.1 Tn7-like element transposition protein TnsE [Priestia flexa]
MRERSVKLNNWPFKKGEQAKLIWFSSPFWHERKLMIHCYFLANGKTEKLLLDWGMLPFLAIQHSYVDGIVSESIAPAPTEEIEITIYPNQVKYFESEWKILNTEEKTKSTGFKFKYRNQIYILPLIESIRSILAPNRFLLYRLLEMNNSFLNYFTESYLGDHLHIDFNSAYEKKYTKQGFLWQLLWIITNPDVRSLYMNIGYIFVDTGELKFEWILNQPIVIKAVIKRRASSHLILRILSVRNKKIPYAKVSFTHPEFVAKQKSSESKKHTYKKVGLVDEPYEIDNKDEGASDDFDLIPIDNQNHGYTNLPRLEKMTNNTSKLRVSTNEDTKQFMIEDSNKRTVADTGGNHLVRGIELIGVHEASVTGELGEFIKILNKLNDFPDVQTVDVKIEELPPFEDSRKFSFLDDGITRRKYALGSVQLLNGHHYFIVEIEREYKSLSMLILQAQQGIQWNIVIEQLLENLVKDNGAWLKESLKEVEDKGVTIQKAKHSKKSYRHRASLIAKKFT